MIVFVGFVVFVIGLTPCGGLKLTPTPRTIHKIDILEESNAMFEVLQNASNKIHPDQIVSVSFLTTLESKEVLQLRSAIAKWLTIEQKVKDALKLKLSANEKVKRKRGFQA